jgi:hypothetical protein
MKRLFVLAALAACNAVTGASDLVVDPAASNSAAPPPPPASSPPPPPAVAPPPAAVIVDASTPEADAAPGPMLAVTSTTPPASNDLTAEGTLDWIYFGHNGIAAPNRKVTGGMRISALTKTGGGAAGENNSPAWTVTSSWSDGTPTASVGSTNWYQYFIAANDIVVTLTAEAAPSLRTLALHTATFLATTRLDVSLSDNSVAPYTEDIVGPATMAGIARRTTIAYRAKAGTTLVVKLSVVQISSAGGGLLVASATLH